MDSKTMNTEYTKVQSYSMGRKMLAKFSNNRKRKIHTRQADQGIEDDQSTSDDLTIMSRESGNSSSSSLQLRSSFSNRNFCNEQQPVWVLNSARKVCNEEVCDEDGGMKKAYESQRQNKFVFVGVYA